MPGRGVHDWPPLFVSKSEEPNRYPTWVLTNVTWSAQTPLQMMPSIVVSASVFPSIFQWVPPSRVDSTTAQRVVPHGRESRAYPVVGFRNERSRISSFVGLFTPGFVTIVVVDNLVPGGDSTLSFRLPFIAATRAIRTIATTNAPLKIH